MTTENRDFDCSGRPQTTTSCVLVDAKPGPPPVFSKVRMGTLPPPGPLRGPTSPQGEGEGRRKSETTFARFSCRNRRLADEE